MSKVPEPKQASRQLPNPGEDNWLKVTDISPEGESTIVLTGKNAIGMSQFGGPCANCEVRIGKVLKTWTVVFFRDGIPTGNYKRLYKKFGDDLNAWKGTIRVEKKVNMGRDYVAVL